jgi:hypothetical protein
MSAALMVHRPGSPPEEVALAGPSIAGGGPADAVRLDGAPPGALALTPSPSGPVVEALAPGAVLRPAGAPPRALPPGSRRLLRPGDSLQLAGAVLEARPEPPPAGTRALAARLLAEAGRGHEPVSGPCLLALEGPDAGRRLPLGEESTLGRGRAATLRLADPGASRSHVRLARARGGFVLRDLGSKNGLRLNGAPVLRRPRALRSGDEIALGRSVLTLVLPAEGPGGTGQPGPEADAAVRPVPAAGAAGGQAGLVGAAALLAGAAALAAAALGA